MSNKSEKTRHILALSGGKDSAALAVYMRDKIPDLEYVFLDTGHELPETYEFLETMKAVLGIRIVHIRSDRSFEDWLKLKNYYLPSPQKRWCTQELKIKPFEKYIGSDRVYSYAGVRADEVRDLYESSKPNIISRYPFIEDGLVLADIEYILTNSIGWPKYYKWRSRSGCYFCFFQQKVEWLSLNKLYPKLFQKAMSYEKVEDGIRFTWCQDESLSELLEREEEIRKNNEELIPLRKPGKKKVRKLMDILPEDFSPCSICD